MTRPPCPLLAVDMIIEHEYRGKEGIVLIERKFAPYGLALPGGHAEYGKSLEAQCVIESAEETGLDAEVYTPERPFRVYSEPDRDPRYHMATAVYVGRGTGTIRASTDAKQAFHVPIARIPLLFGRNMFAFGDHERALREYLAWRETRD